MADELDFAREMAAFEAAFPYMETALYKNGAVIAGRPRYAEPEHDRMFSAWLSGRRTTSEPAVTDERVGGAVSALRELAARTSRPWVDDAVNVFLAALSTKAVEVEDRQDRGASGSGGQS